MSRRLRGVCFIQYSNPGAYPPVDHASKILADRGWRVLVLGVEDAGTRDLELAPCPGRRVLRFRACPSPWARPAHYFFFAVWCLSQAVRWGADWVYVSDLHACPVGLLAAMLRRGSRSVYHEHDAPSERRKLSMRACLLARRRLVRASACTVAPNAHRLDQLMRETSGDPGRAHCVWNCPLRSELPGLGRPSGSKVFRVLYHGSVNDQRLPLQVVKAVASLPQDVRLRVVGYETIGHPRYFELLRAAARESGIEDRVEIVGALRRDELLRMATESDLGLSLMPVSSQDPNLEDMVGASNKPFDYLACGLPLLVTRRKDWEEMYVAAGLARACAPTDAEDIAAQIRWFYEHRDQAAAMGRRGRELIRECWNYETQFEPVLRRLEEDRD